MTHIMIDTETWGTEPGCDIRSIGACVFDPVAGTYSDTDQFYIACDNPRIQMPAWKPYKYDLKRDPQTVQWWSEQSDEAQAAFADPVDLAECLHRFSTWVFRLTDQLYDRHGIGKCEPSPDIRLWAHGPQFDASILAVAYKAVQLPVPWHYRAPRDTRTCFDMAGIDDHSAWLEQHPGPLGILHHALDDAICQARAVCGAYARVQGWRDAHEQMEDAAADARFEDRG